MQQLATPVSMFFYQKVFICTCVRPAVRRSICRLNLFLVSGPCLRIVLNYYPPIYGAAKFSVALIRFCGRFPFQEEPL